MATTIVTKNGTGAPTDSDLVAGELAVDLTNGRLYTTDLDSGGTVIEIGLNPSGNVDVTGTVTADGLTVDGSTTFTGNTSPASDEVLLNLSSLNGTGTAGNMLRFTDLDPTATNNGSIGKIQFYSDDTDAVVVEIEGQNADASPDGRLIFKTAEGTTLRKRINIENNGDISFYEDTGTTAKFFWDASAESLGIGTTSPSEVLNVKTSSGNSYVDVERATQAQGEVGLKISGGTSGADWFVYQPASSNDLRFYKTGDKVTIDSSGNLLVGTTDTSPFDSSTEQGTVISDGQAQIAGTSTPLYVNRQASNGNLVDFRKDGATVGSIGSYNGVDLYIGDGEAGVKFSNDNNNIIPWNTNTNASRGDNTDLGGSSDRFRDLYLSGGAYLGGTAAANKLDDYEEGLHTVTVTPSTSGSVTLNNPQVRYTKIGNTVFISGNIRCTSVSSPVGTSIQFSLPFPIADGAFTSERIGSAIVYYDGSSDGLAFITADTGTTTYVKQTIDASTIAAGDQWRFNFFYVTS